MTNITERDAMPEAEFIKKRDAMLAEWEKTATQAAKLREAEMEQRKAFIAFVSDPAKVKGTENIELANGYKAKIVKGQRMTLDKDKVNEKLDEIERIGGEAGKLIADRLVNFKPELSITEYAQLEPRFKLIIDTIITTSDSSPTLEIVAPKSKKVM